MADEIHDLMLSVARLKLERSKPGVSLRRRNSRTRRIKLLQEEISILRAAKWHEGDIDSLMVDIAKSQDEIDRFRVLLSAVTTLTEKKHIAILLQEAARVLKEKSAAAKLRLEVPKQETAPALAVIEGGKKEGPNKPPTPPNLFLVREEIDRQEERRSRPLDYEYSISNPQQQVVPVIIGFLLGLSAAMILRGPK